jgi:protoporphyrinogen oxidase
LKRNTFILGAGMTGLAAGFVSGLTVFEANNMPGGICSSYYIRSGEKVRLSVPPDDGEAYRFEFGGGHWIFGFDKELLQFLDRFVSSKEYSRCSSVYFRNSRTYVPYPIQNSLRYLGSEIAESALAEIAVQPDSFDTMKEWLTQYFGPTLCDLFFYPFHELYTAGLYDRINPQDAYKSPVDLSLAIKGASGEISQAGYNVSFVYPVEGLNTLALRISDKCDIRYNKRVVKIDPHNKELFFDDSSSILYDRLISTLPLNKIIAMSGIEISAEPDPYTSVLVLNIGGKRGGQCPDDHWIYIPDARPGFHRVGFYSNVDRSFLPVSSRKGNSKVGIYVEKAYPGGEKPSDDEILKYIEEVSHELQAWDFIGDVEVADPTWIDVAYTWSWPNSPWKKMALENLEKYEIYQVGRYGRWAFQGIAESLRDGLSIISSIT